MFSRARIRFGESAYGVGAAMPRGRTAQLVNDVELLFRPQAARAGETDPAAKQVFGDASTVSLRPGIERLRMHRFPYGTRFDSGAVEPRDQLIARAPEPVF